MSFGINQTWVLLSALVTLVAPGKILVFTGSVICKIRILKLYSTGLSVVPVITYVSNIRLGGRSSSSESVRFHWSALWKVCDALGSS